MISPILSTSMEIVSIAFLFCLSLVASASVTVRAHRLAVSRER
nr:MULTISPECIES: hypothetical protein [Leptospira]